MFYHIPSSHVDALEDVHLGGRGRVGVVLRGGVADGVDQDVVVHLFRVAACEGSGFTDQSKKNKLSFCSRSLKDIF
jgi:hypothetical protein